jgi:hypothetical protein
MMVPSVFTFARRAAGMLAVVVCGFGPTAARAQLTIVPTYAANLTSDPNALTIENTINQAIAEYAARFSNNISVTIQFQEGGGLGSSSTLINSIPYVNYRTALLASATTTNDAIANATLPNQVNSPADGQADMWVARPLSRALGFGVGSSGFDSTITLNTSIMNLDRTTIDPAKYDLKAVAQHEIDEALGFGSGLGLPVSFPRQSEPEDLFRYNGLNSHSYTTSSSEVSYFSIDGGLTPQLNFNQSGTGDFGDWASSGTAHVQDAFGTPGATPDLNVELTALDVIGYSLVPVPEPTAMLLTAAGMAAVLLRRRRRTS